MAGGPEPSKCCLKCASCSADRTYSMSPARTSATNHSRSTTLRGVGIVCPTPVRCTGSYRVTMASTTSTRTCGVSPDTKNPLGSAPLWDRLERHDGPLRIRDSTTGPTRQARGRSKSLRVRESKIPLPGRQTYSRLHKSTLLRHRKEGGCTSV